MRTQALAPWAAWYLGSTPSARVASSSATLMASFGLLLCAVMTGKIVANAATLRASTLLPSSCSARRHRSTERKSPDLYTPERHCIARSGDFLSVRSEEHTSELQSRP